MPSRLGYLLGYLAPKDLEKIIYFAANIITSVDEEGRHNDQSTLEAEMMLEKKEVEADRDAELAERSETLEQDLAEAEAAGLKADAKRKIQTAAEREMRHIRERAERELHRLDEIWNTFVKLAPKQMIVDENIYTELQDRYEDYFTGGMGAESIQTLIRNFDLEAEAESLREVIRDGKPEETARAEAPEGCCSLPALWQRSRWHGLGLHSSDSTGVASNGSARWWSLRNLRPQRSVPPRYQPQQPPEAHVGSRRPEIIVNNEKRMLQESVDALFDNGRRGRPVTGQATAR